MRRSAEDTNSKAGYTRAHGIDKDQLERYKLYRDTLLNSEFFQNLKTIYDDKPSSLALGPKNDLDIDTLFGIHTGKRTWGRADQHFHRWCTITGDDKQNSDSIDAWMRNSQPMIAAWTHDTDKITAQIKHFRDDFPTLSYSHFNELGRIALKIRENAIAPYKAGLWNNSPLNERIHEQSKSSVGPTSQFAIYMWLCINGTAQLFNQEFYRDEEWEEKYYHPYLNLLTNLANIDIDHSNKSQTCNIILKTDLVDFATKAKQIRQTFCKTQCPVDAADTLKSNMEKLDTDSIQSFIRDTLTIGNAKVAVMQMMDSTLHSETATIDNTIDISNAVAAMEAIKARSLELSPPLQRLRDTHTRTASRSSLRDQSSREDSLTRATSRSRSGVLVSQGDDHQLTEIPHKITTAITSLQEKNFIENSASPVLVDLINQSVHSLIELQRLRLAAREIINLLKDLGNRVILMTNGPFLTTLMSINTLISTHSQQTLVLFESIRKAIDQTEVQEKTNSIKMTKYREQVTACLGNIEGKVRSIEESSVGVKVAVETLLRDGELQFQDNVLNSYFRLAQIEEQAATNLSRQFPLLMAKHNGQLRGVFNDIDSASSLVYMHHGDSADLLAITDGGSGETKSPAELDSIDLGSGKRSLSRSASTDQLRRLMDDTPKPQQRRATTSGLGESQDHVANTEEMDDIDHEDRSSNGSTSPHSEAGSDETNEISYNQTHANIDAGITALAALYNKKHTLTFATIQKDGKVANGGVLDEAEIALLLIAKHPELRAPTSVTINELISELKITLIPNKAKSSGPYRIKEIVYGCNDVPFSISNDLDRQAIANCFYAAKDAGLVEKVKAKNKWRWGEGDRIINAGKTAALISRDITEKNLDSFNNLQYAEGLLKILRKETESYYSEKLHPLVYNYLIKIISLAKNPERLDGELSISNKVQNYFKDQTYLTAQTKDAQKGLIAALLTQQPDGWDNFPYDFKKHYIKKLSIILQFILRGGKQNLSAHLGLNPDTEDKDLAENIIGWLSHQDNGRLERVIATVIELKGFRYGLANIVNKYYLAADNKIEDFSTELQAKSFWESLTNLKYQSIVKENSQELIIQHIQSATRYKDRLNQRIGVDRLIDVLSLIESSTSDEAGKISKRINELDKHIDALEIIKSTRAVQFAIHSAAPKDQRLVEIILNRIFYNSVFSSNTDEVLKLINCLNDNIDLTKLKIDPKLQLFKILYDFLKDPTNIQLSAKIGARELADLYGILSEEFLTHGYMPKDEDIKNIASIVTGIMREDEFRDHIKTIKSIIKQKLTFESLSIIANLYTTEKNNRPSFRAPSPEELRERYNTSNSAPPTDGEGANEKRIIRVIDAYIKELRTFTETDQIMRILSGQGILVADNMISSLTDEAIENLESELLSIGHSVTESEIKSMLCAAVTAATLANSTQQPTETNAPDLNNAIQLAKTIAQREDASDDDKKAASLLLFSAMKELMPSNVAASDEDTHDQSGQIETKEPEEEVNTQDDVAQPTSASVTAASLDILQKRLQSKYEEAQHRNQARLSHPEEKEGDNDIESTDSIHAAFSESQNQIAQWKDFLKGEYSKTINGANTVNDNADQLIEDALRSYTSALGETAGLTTLADIKSTDIPIINRNKNTIIDHFSAENMRTYFEKCSERDFTVPESIKNQIIKLAQNSGFFGKANRRLRASKILVLIGFIEKAILEKTERLIKAPDDQTSVQDIFSDLICASDNMNEISQELQAAHAILNRTRGIFYWYDKTGARSRTMISELRTQADAYRNPPEDHAAATSSLAELTSRMGIFSPQTAMSRNNSSVNIRAGLDERDDLRADAITRPNQPVVVRNNLPGQTSTTDIEQKEGERTGVPTI